MRFVYRQFDDDLFARLKALSDLMAIFEYLLMRLGGNVDRTLQLMRNLQREGIISDKYDLNDFARSLRKSKLLKKTSGGFKLSGKGERKLRQDAFDLIFQKMRPSGRGQHVLPYEGGNSEEMLPERRPYSFGDNIRAVDFGSSLFNSIKRSGDLGLNMSERDLEVFESERSTSCATVLMIDISHSMILYGEDRITPAKQVAMAFTELILKHYPKDDLTIVTFGDEARQVPISELPYLSVGPYHTNTQAGLRMARQILMSRKHVNKQIFMITDGKPSVITRPNGEVYRNPMGLDPRIVNRTLDEAVQCRKKKITITTYMITDDPYLQQFVQRLTELNRGRAYFSSVDNLGSYVLWDFVSNRKKRG